MTIVSCIKQVRDLDIVLKDDWCVASDGLTIDISYANHILNTFDETSLELMLGLSDREPVTTRVVTLGQFKSEASLRKALAAGVDKATRINTAENYEFRPEQVAYQLKNYMDDLLESGEEVDLIMCGREGDNGSHGQTGQILAEMLGWPCVTMVVDIDKEDGMYKISRLVDDGIEYLYINQPLVVTVTQANNKQLRMASLKSTLMAKKKELEIIQAKTSYGGGVPPYRLDQVTINRPEKECSYLRANEKSSIGEQLAMIIKSEIHSGEV